MGRVPYRGGRGDNVGGRIPAAGRGRHHDRGRVLVNEAGFPSTRSQRRGCGETGSRQSGRGMGGRQSDVRGRCGRNQSAGISGQTTTTTKAGSVAAADTTSKADSEEKLSPWRSSKAKKRLNALLRDESSWVQGLAPFQIWFHDKEFKKYPQSNFKTNCQNLIDKVLGEQDAVDYDKMAVTNDRQLFPPNQVHRYEGSAAQKKLKEDVESGRSKSMPPHVLWETTPEYRATFESARRFRSHKYKEERVLTEKVYWQKKRNDKGRKKHESELAKMQDEYQEK